MGLPRLLAGRRRGLMARLLANGLAQAAAAFAVAWLVREALESSETNGIGIPAPVIAGLIASGLLLLVLRTLERVDAERLGQEYVTKVRLRLFERIACRPSRQERGERFGLTMTRLVNDLNSLRNWVSVGVARMAVAGVSLLGVLAALAYFDPGAAVIVAGVLAACALTTAALTPRLRERVREARRRRGKLAGNLGEKILAFATIRHHGRTDAELKRLRWQSRRMTEALVLRMRAAGVLRALPDAAFPLAVAALVVLAGWGGGGGELIVTLLLLGMLMASLRDLLQAWDYRLSFEEGRRRIVALLSGPRVRPARRGRSLPGSGPLSIELQRVRVEGVLRDASAFAEAGDRVLVTGPAGAGKSTLLGLLARLFDADSGAVLLGGEPLPGLSLDSLQESVRLVSPELPLLRGSVRANLAYGSASEAPTGLAAAAELCGLAAPAPGLPQGLDTSIREQGAGLSDSLRSRVALARALASEPRVLLIDDPLLFMDGSGRAVVEAVLGAVRATVLVVGPDEDALPGADRIWRVEGGRVHELPPTGGADPGLRVVDLAGPTYSQPAR